MVMFDHLIFVIVYGLISKIFIWARGIFEVIDRQHANILS